MNNMRISPTRPNVMATDASITGPINLGNPVEFTILELAETVIELTGSRSKTIWYPLPTDDPRQHRPDMSLAQSTLGWQPRVPLSVGLEKTITYFDRLLAENAHELAEIA
jgi:UDP-glucuronate decarboxylase